MEPNIVSTNVEGSSSPSYALFDGWQKGKTRSSVSRSPWPMNLPCFFLMTLSLLYFARGGDFLEKTCQEQFLGDPWLFHWVTKTLRKGNYGLSEGAFDKFLRNRFLIQIQFVFSCNPITKEILVVMGYTGESTSFFKRTLL